MSASIKQNKLHATPLADVLSRSALPPEAAAKAVGLADPADIIAALAQAGFLVEASRVAAHALPKREAVWWACMCAASNAPPGIGAPDAKARELAESWVRDKNDETRRAAMDHARLAGFQSPEAWAAVAAFWSGDSITPLTAPAVAPPPHLAGLAVAGAVALASVRGKPGRQPQRLERFLLSMRDIAAGGAGRLEPEAE